LNVLKPGANILPPSHSDIDFVRRARKLRATLAARPDQLHRALKEMTAPEQQLIEPAPKPASRAQVFAELVVGQLQGDLLRYSARLDLLRQADRMGIERFEANLIIAAMQHRADPDQTPQHPAPVRHFTAGHLALLVFISEAILLTAVCWHGTH
jgi:hypothetical protein